MASEYSTTRSTVRDEEDPPLTLDSEEEDIRPPSTKLPLPPLQDDAGYEMPPPVTGRTCADLIYTCCSSIASIWTVCIGPILWFFLSILCCPCARMYKRYTRWALKKEIEGCELEKSNLEAKYKDMDESLRMELAENGNNLETPEIESYLEEMDYIQESKQQILDNLSNIRDMQYTKKRVDLTNRHNHIMSKTIGELPSIDLRTREKNKQTMSMYNKRIKGINDVLEKDVLETTTPLKLTPNARPTRTTVSPWRSTYLENLKKEVAKKTPLSSSITSGQTPVTQGTPAIPSAPLTTSS